MPTSRTDKNQVFDGQGRLISEEVVTVDTTAETTQADLRTKARQALSTNATFLGIAAPTNAQLTTQLKAITRQNNALIRLLIGTDLLTDNTDT